MTDKRIEWTFNLGDRLRDDIAAGRSVHSPRVAKHGLVAYTCDGNAVVLASNWGYSQGCIDKEVGSSDIEIDEEVELFGQALESYVADLGLPMHPTPSGIAFELLKGEIAEQGLIHDDTLHHWRRTRQAYKGGLSCVIKTWYDLPTAKIDRNSAYPYRMLRPLPAAFSRHSRNIIPEGLYRAHVYIPDMQIPFLQAYTWTKSIAYPVGHLTHTWTGAELIYAESQGVRIERVFSGRLPTRTLDLSGVVQRLLDARRDLPKPFNSWAKTAVNSIAGLLGRREFMPVYRIGSIPSGWRGVSLGNLAVEIGTTDIFSMSQYSMPGTAAHITADTRIDLHRMAGQIGWDSCFYMDTDAIAFAADKIPNVKGFGTGVGEWKLETVAPTYACDRLRRIRWGHTCAPTDMDSGNYLCGRIVAGTYTIPVTIREACLAEGVTNEKSKNVHVQNHTQQEPGHEAVGRDVVMAAGCGAG